MKPLQPIPWIAPLQAAASVKDTHCVLLHSGMQTSYSGRFSYLAYGLKEMVQGNDLAALAAKLTQDLPWYENAWFGYLGYGLRHGMETLSADASPSIINLPDMTMMRFGTILRFDHEQHTVEGWSESGEPMQFHASVVSESLPAVQHFASNMSNDEYQEKVRRIIASIHDGDLYQANLTRKFHGEFTAPAESLSLFQALCAASPAPYSAYIRLGNVAICSSSPELFLRIADGRAEARPIKGTSPRSDDTAADKASYQSLAKSDKDKAENLMITDLMRNDLSRTCQPGSIEVRDMFAITSLSNVHHMASTVSGQIRSGHTALETVQACFPPRLHDRRTQDPCYGILHHAGRHGTRRLFRCHRLFWWRRQL